MATGVTEEYWRTLNEDERIYWRLFTRGLTLVLSLVIVRTGWKYVDWIIASLMTVLPMLIIDSQRAYSKISRPLRRLITKVAIRTGSWLVATLGVIYIAPQTLAAIFNGTGGMVKPIERLSMGNEYIAAAIFLVLFALVLRSVIKCLRQLGYEELIFQLPRRILIDVMVRRRRSPVRNFHEFAKFELQVLMGSLMYTATASAVGAVFVGLFTTGL
jgi:hypothetical protein